MPSPVTTTKRQIRRDLKRHGHTPGKWWHHTVSWESLDCLTCGRYAQWYAHNGIITADGYALTNACEGSGD